MRSPARGLYVTGTDTGVGKTVASVALLQALRAAGCTAAGMKPVASGCERTEAGWRNDDALALQAASAPSQDYDTHNPYALPAATAPQLAARRAGVAVQPPVIESAYARLRDTADVVVVEGVGGWLAPLADELEQAQLVRSLGLPVVLVVGLRLGCLNHARLSARAIVEDGARLLGWIGSACDPDFDDVEDYRALLQSSLPVPCLGWLARGCPPQSPSAQLSVAVLLDQLSAGVEVHSLPYTG